MPDTNCQRAWMIYISSGGFGSFVEEWCSTSAFRECVYLKTINVLIREIYFKKSVHSMELNQKSDFFFFFCSFMRSHVHIYKD